MQDDTLSAVPRQVVADAKESKRKLEELEGLADKHVDGTGMSSVVENKLKDADAVVKASVEHERTLSDFSKTAVKHRK